MKLYRLLEILIYLLNHKKATAKLLAEKFEVSTRTIQRDMDALLIAGVPIESTPGIYGGYYLDSSYKLENQFVCKDDFSFIMKALKSYSTYLDDKQIKLILEKYKALSPLQNNDAMYLDYSVSKENDAVQLNNIAIEAAIHSKRQIRFDYYNINNFKSSKQVQPLVLRFKWYQWYLFAYDIEKSDYRTYKVARIQNLTDTETAFELPDLDIIQKLLEQHDTAYLNTCEEICIWCHRDSIQIAKEYFPIDKIIALEDCNYHIFFSVPRQEQLWQANLLHMGNRVKILSPSAYREHLVQLARDFLSINDI